MEPEMVEVTSKQKHSYGKHQYLAGEKYRAEKRHVSVLVALGHVEPIETSALPIVGRVGRSARRKRQ